MGASPALLAGIGAHAVEIGELVPITTGAGVRRWLVVDVRPGDGGTESSVLISRIVSETDNTSLRRSWRCLDPSLIQSSRASIVIANELSMLFGFP